MTSMIAANSGVAHRLYAANVRPAEAWVGDYLRERIEVLVENNKFVDYLSDDPVRISAAFDALSLIFDKARGVSEEMQICIDANQHTDPKIAIPLRTLIEGMFGPLSKDALAANARRLQTRAHPDKTRLRLPEKDSKMVAIVAKHLWALYRCVVQVVENRALLDAIYAASEQAPLDRMEPAQPHWMQMISSMRRLLRRNSVLAIGILVGVAGTAAALLVSQYGVSVGVTVAMLVGIAFLKH